MKIELKNLKYSADLSEETPAFSATLVVNGVERGCVRNSGRGGANIWLKGLPLLQHTLHIPPRIVEYPKGSGKMVKRWANQTDSGQNKLTPSATRWKERSKTYQGISDAMASQWGGRAISTPSLVQLALL